MSAAGPSLTRLPAVPLALPATKANHSAWLSGAITVLTIGYLTLVALAWHVASTWQPQVGRFTTAGVIGCGAISAVLAIAASWAAYDYWRRAQRSHISFAGRTAAPTRGPRRDPAARPAGEGPHRDNEVVAYLALSQAIDDYIGGSGSVHDLLTDVANCVGVTIAYVDRKTVEAHLFTDLDPQQWAAITEATQAMDFDRWIGDSSGERGEFITRQLQRARELHPDVPLPEATPW